MASGESDGATSVRPPRSASSSTCAAIACGIPVGVADDLRDEVVLHRRPQQVLGVEIEGAPLERQLRGALKKLARGVREELA